MTETSSGGTPATNSLPAVATALKLVWVRMASARFSATVAADCPACVAIITSWPSTSAETVPPWAVPNRSSWVSTRVTVGLKLQVSLLPGVMQQLLGSPLKGTLP